MILAQFPGQLFDVTDEAINKACEVESVDEAGLVCRNVFEWTQNGVVARGADWLTTAPLRILLIFVVAIIVNRVIRRVIKKSVAELSDTQARERKARLTKMTPKALRSTQEVYPLRAAARAETIGSVLKSVASIVIYSIATLLALSEVGINLAPLIAGAGIIGVALGFGAQSLVQDFLSGLFMLAEDQYGVGDVINVGEAEGTVEVVNLRTTRLRDVNGTVWHVPNGEIRRVGNMSQQWARALLDIDVAYDTDLDRAMEVVKEVADEVFHADEWKVDMLEEPEVWGVQSLGADGITIRLVIKTQPGQQWKVTRELNRRMKDRFDKESIEIPFPQRVMWVRRDEGSSRDEVIDPVESADS
ncbi:mechanosensitive ion channel family protein [Actinospongicola halichondriae]|uniref:mechanosensitive ion channel family protein n=1 Tax=Actinospongicola halichondriae TaxID=3236844 RepID=UPI003D52B229